jgi:hypothetical protein
MRARSLGELLHDSRTLSWERFGRRVTFHLPGMFIIEGRRGCYPAVSITSSRCELGCDHCRGRILDGMPHVSSPQELLERCLAWDEHGAKGVLITGASDISGRLPWDGFLEAIRLIKARTSLHISVHSGIVDTSTACGLREAGVDQVLVDVVGDETTARQVLHLPHGLKGVKESLRQLAEAGLQIVPHICIGLHYGRLRGERRAMDILEEISPAMIVWIVLMPLRGTPMEGVKPPAVEDVGRLLSESRLRFPDSEISLGCARPRGRIRELIEAMAVDAGVNRMALYSQRAVEKARSYGLEITYMDTCCSVGTIPVPDQKATGKKNRKTTRGVRHHEDPET